MAKGPLCTVCLITREDTFSSSAHDCDTGSLRNCCSYALKPSSMILLPQLKAGPLSGRERHRGLCRLPLSPHVAVPAMPEELVRGLNRPGASDSRGQHPHSCCRGRWRRRPHDFDRWSYPVLQAPSPLAALAQPTTSREKERGKWGLTPFVTKGNKLRLFQ